MPDPQQPPSVPPGWEVVSDASTGGATPVAGNGVPEGWSVADDAPQQPTNWMGGVSAATAAGAAAIPAAKWLAEHIATSPLVSAGMQRVGGMAGGLNVGKLGYDLVTGRNPLQAAGSAAKNEALRQGAKLAYRGAAPVAQGLGAEGVAGMAAPAAVPLAGGLAGLAGTTGFLAALQHDANRHVDIDYSQHTPATDIAKVFMNMRNSEANRGKTRDERMDDPNDVMFSPDESVTVRQAVLSQLGQR